jgi:hypothetical protein
MTFHEYNQLLKFLYFEGYAESYEEAEYIIEDLNDGEFVSLYEEVFPLNPMLEYLIDEGYADTVENAEVILNNMSEDWEYHIIQEMRKEDKVAGKKKTPIYISKTTKKVEPSPEGSGKKWSVNTKEYKTTNPVATFGRAKQGLPATPSDYRPNYNTTSGRGSFDKPNPHGAHRNVRGAARDGTTADVVGSKRGVKRIPGEKSTPLSPGSRNYRHGAIRHSKAQREAGKGFSGWSKSR